MRPNIGTFAKTPVARPRRAAYFQDRIVGAVRAYGRSCQDWRAFEQVAAREGGWVQSGVLPLRPLTLGELLDAAVALLRSHAWVFLGVGFGLAAVEQAVLYPLKVATTAEPIFPVPYSDRLGLWWFMIALGLGTETAIVALLGGLTSRAAAPALLGERSSARQLLATAGSRFAAVVVVAAAAGAVAFVAAMAGLVAWPLVYGFVGLAVPAVVIDRVGPLRAVGRSLVLSGQSAMRAPGIRLIGYLAWGAVRLALGLGSIALIDLVVDDPVTLWVCAAVARAGVNATAYSALACLDAVLHLETRMRTEGLDIALARAAATGRPAAPILAVPSAR
jgi:hypothetical protein